MRHKLILAAAAVLAVAYAGRPENLARFDAAIRQALTGTRPDTCTLADSRGIGHRAFTDSAGVWYQTNDPAYAGPDSWTVPIRMARGRADNPFLAVMLPEGPSGQAGTLVLFWREQEGAAAMVRCRWHRHPDPFWRWSLQVVVAVD